MKRILELGAGKNYYKGNNDEEVIHIDFLMLPHIEVIHDLDSYPYPFKDNEFDEVRASHIIEHLKDLIKTMEEIHRIAKPNAKIIIKVPYFAWSLAQGHPTHRKMFSLGTFYYFDKECWEKYSEKYSDRFFKLEKAIIRFKKEGNCSNTMKFIGKIIDFFANIKPAITDRYFPHFLGGFEELYFELRVLK